MSVEILIYHIRKCSVYFFAGSSLVNMLQKYGGIYDTCHFYACCQKFVEFVSFVQTPWF